jgi:hypothetical protein
MDLEWIVPVLAMLTLLAVLVFALSSKKAVEERKDDPFAPTSTLAKDGPQGGVAALDPTLPPQGRNPYARPVLD